MDPFRDRFCFRIADVRLAVLCDPVVRLQLGNPLYRSFRTVVPSGNQKIDLRLHFGKLPLLEKAEKMFDTEESWAMFRKGRHRWIVYHPRLQDSPLWIARFGRGAERLDYYGRLPFPSGKKTAEPIRPLCHPLDQLIFMYFLARRNGILTHSAGMAYRGKAYLFAGASGAGKSTFSELLVKTKTGKVLSDERMVVREIDGNMAAFGTPWAGTARIARNGSAPLAGIFFLKHGKTNRIEKLDPITAADRLLPVASVPWYDLDTATPIIAFAKHLTGRVPAYEFRFTPDAAAIDSFLRFIKRTS